MKEEEKVVKSEEELEENEEESQAECLAKLGEAEILVLRQALSN